MSLLYYIRSGVTILIHTIVSGLLMSGFTFFRYLFSIFYLLKLQPFRSISFSLANLCTILLGIWTFASMFF
jgi:uncharacterized MAPEG superfamily protein